MKLISLLILVAGLSASAKVKSQQISYSGKKVPLVNVLSVIKKQSGYVFFYTYGALSKARPVSLNVKDASLKEVLTICFKNQPLTYKIEDKTILIKQKKEEIKASSIVAPIQTPIVVQDPIHGIVTDSSGEPIAGASIFIKGMQKGAISNAKGEYEINAKEGDILEFNFIGFKSKDVRVGQSNEINVVLLAETSSLNDIVIIGYGTSKKKDLTGSIASISGDDIKQIPVATAAEAITGKIAGVNVVTQSGAPGADVNIVIRGGTSITQSIAPLYIVDGFESGDLSSIDVNDIATIDVLKDASATAIYGARGSNGVIVITTKSGKAGKTRVTYNGYMNIQKLANQLNLMNPEQYVDYQYEYQILNGNEAQWAKNFGSDINNPDFYTGAADYIKNTYGSNPGIDWQNLVFGGSALMQSHSVSVSGGDAKTKFMLNGNFLNQGGILSKHGYQKYNLRFKISHDISKSVHLDFNSNFNNTKVDGGGSMAGNLRMSILQPPTGGVRFTNEQLINDDLTDSMRQDDPTYDAYNPIIRNDAVTQSDYTKEFTANAGITIDILKNLFWRTQGSYAWTQKRSNYWDDGRTEDAREKHSGPYGSIGNSESFSWQLTNTLTWKKNFGRHQITALVGQQTNASQSTSSSNTYDGFPQNNFGLNNIGMATNLYAKSSGLSRSRTVSAFGRVMYNYDERYLLTATIRGDGVSKFAEGHQWGTFPSMSAAWRISEEKFMKDSKLFNQLKLRVGYGATGNSNISNYMYVTSYGAGFYAINRQEVSTLVPGGTLANPFVQWEKTATTDIGLDMSILKSRINLTVDYYNNESKNLLLNANIPASTGYSTQFQNIGAISNRGLEFALNTENIENKNFNWSTNFNISFNRSKVLSLSNGNSTYYSGSFIVQVGKPLGQFYGYKYDGIYTTDDFTQNNDGSYSLKDGVARQKGGTAPIKPGDIKLTPTTGQVDANGNPVWSTDDRTVIGNSAPKFTGGLTNTFSYKGFDLSIFMNFCYGNQVFDENDQRFLGPRLPNQNALAVMASRFKLIDPQTGKETTSLSRLAALNPDQNNPKAVWSVDPNNNYNATSTFSDYFLQDGSFLRLNTITLGYTLPKNILKRASISRFRVYATLNNIYNFTKYKGYDPEVANSSGVLGGGVDDSAYPRTKGFVFGVNLTF
ncbi:TonB-dependent receptor [Arachidicoccus sp.]|uniref:TonB-dependent receptor n=1 Tax=Arachidicoccus sp. TaxID=1872624 RepID=UPI003D1FBB3B